MYKKLFKIFIGNNISKFILIIFCITLSLTGFLISDNLINNVQILIGNDSKPLLGGDIKIESQNELNKDQLDYLKTLEKENKIVSSVKIQTYTTILDKQSNPSLVSLIFVDEKYPLYGIFDIKEKKSGDGVYVSQNVEDLFVKDNQVEVYGKIYNIKGIINKIPDSGINFYDDGKKIVLDISEFDMLKLDEFGAKINRNYLIKVNNLNDFEQILENLKNTEIFGDLRITDYTKGGDMFSELFGELDKYIKYILIISFILTILIIFLSVESFYLLNKKQFSILRILGIKNKNLIYFNIILFFSILMVSLIITILLSESSFSIIRNFDLTNNFYISNLSILKTSILGVLILGLSVILPLFKFLSNNPLAGLKENFLEIYTKKDIYKEIILMIIGIILVYVLIIGNLLDGIFFTLILFLLIFTLSFIIKYILNFVYSKVYFLKNKKFYIYDSIRSTVNPGNLSILICFGFIISFTSLLFISIISLNFLDKLNIDLNNNNNIYVINLNEKDLENIDDIYKEQAYSIILGRILSINGKNLKEHLGNSGESGQFTREFNITDNELSDVKILEGNKIKPGEVSVDDDFAKSLDLKIGDEVEFLIYGIKKKLIVSNIRQSISEGVQPFFYFQVYKEDFIDFPKSYFLSTYVPLDDIKQFKNDFLEQTGNQISFIELDVILEEIKSISNKVLIVIQVLFIYVFIFCTISLIISIIFLIPFKKKKSYLYNILGAQKKYIKKNNLFEYFYLQTLSFLISIIIASSSTYYILNKSSFINFGINNYFLSISFLFLIFLLLSILINFLVGKITSSLVNK